MHHNTNQSKDAVWRVYYENPEAGETESLIIDVIASAKDEAIQLADNRLEFHAETKAEGWSSLFICRLVESDQLSALIDTNDNPSTKEEMTLEQDAVYRELIAAGIDDSENLTESEIELR